MFRICTVWGVLATLLFFFGAPAFGQEPETVASLDRIDGRVQVIKAETGQTQAGRNGLLLRAGDTVVTNDDTRVTIKFRDGSEVRMFPNSRFLIQNIKEASTKDRTFSYKLFLKLGSLWGKFAPQRQVANLELPTATIGIKGTAFRATHRDDRSRVALTEGHVEVRNEAGAVDLFPGKRLSDFTANDNLATKVEDIPYKIEVRSEVRELNFPGSRPQEVFVTLQLQDIKSGAQIQRAGKLYFRSNYERITYPPSANLNQRGFARVPLLIAPPEPSDEKLDGNIYVWALIDEEPADDTVEGRILFTFPVAGGKERIRIEADTGEGKRMN